MHNNLKRVFAHRRNFAYGVANITRRTVCKNSRTRLSNVWIPTQAKKDDDAGHDLLIRAGFYRQAHSGIFHFLPLGSRVMAKLENLLDQHMTRLGASKVSLSSITSQELWQQTGRLNDHNAEFFKLQDRKKARFLLAPTHEEEIASLVADNVNSHKDLPLRLYQISRKYRDEARPRQGLLRGREFVMKDLYTFDATEEKARETYELVRRAYHMFLDDLRVPYIVASADSGNMGGSLSHEFHFSSLNGEDTIIQCTDCDFSINEELNHGSTTTAGTNNDSEVRDFVRWMGLSKDRKTLVKAYIPVGCGSINLHAIKALIPDIDQSIDLSESTTEESTANAIVLIDPRVSREAVSMLEKSALVLQPTKNLLTKAHDGVSCPKCALGTLHLTQAVEIGHTFHLGTRYSQPLDVTVADASNQRALVHMGCHGIGVSRIVGAVASLLADDRGLRWPLAIAPFSCVLVPTDDVAVEDVHSLYDQCSDVPGLEHFDVAIDDRKKPLGWKLKDADLIGYPFIVVLGKAWKRRRAVELQCRMLSIKEEVDEHRLLHRIQHCITRL